MSTIIKKIKKSPILFFTYAKLFFIYKKARFRQGVVRLFHKKVIFIDSASFVAMYVDIFINEAYKFQADGSQPLILDCGANIGLSIIYFKKLYPGAIIEAFEPDSKVFNVLDINCKTFGFKNVTLINKGIWVHNDGINFLPDGADGGRIVPDSPQQSLEKIKTVRLRELLEKDREIDLLKIDIEGAEVKVLSDCREKLSHVKLLFVEYHSSAGHEQRLDELLTILTEAGFRYYINSIGGVAKNYFLHHDEQAGFDLQLNIYARRG
ncbi:MAG TPA: FkbM family methyltransferase [Candidatus Paceibacterota bacterium]|nr:FkbM family methyltransferase [Candidatus Paceibacterota bacterium]